MGSIGSGTFSDYSRRKPSQPEGKDGGGSGIDKCSLAFSTNLDDVGRCFFYINYSDVPQIDTVVSLAFNGVRIVVENSLGEEIGYLPTQYNYIRYCINEGFTYEGTISLSSNVKLPTIRVDFIPIS